MYAGQFFTHVKKTTAMHDPEPACTIQNKSQAAYSWLTHVTPAAAPADTQLFCPEHNHAAAGNARCPSAKSVIPAKLPDTRKKKRYPARDRVGGSVTEPSSMPPKHNRAHEEPQG